MDSCACFGMHVHILWSSHCTTLPSRETSTWRRDILDKKWLCYAVFFYKRKTSTCTPTRLIAQGKPRLVAGLKLAPEGPRRGTCFIRKSLGAASQIQRRRNGFCVEDEVVAGPREKGENAAEKREEYVLSGLASNWRPGSLQELDEPGTLPPNTSFTEKSIQDHLRSIIFATSKLP